MLRLHDAAKIGDTNQLRSLFANKTLDINHPNRFGRTPLMVAAYHGKTAAAILLLQAGAHVDARDKFDSTALIFAALNGHGLIVAALVCARATIDLHSRDGTTALLGAACHGHTSCVRILVEAGGTIVTSLRDGTVRDARASAVRYRHRSTVLAIDELVKFRLRTFLLGTHPRIGQQSAVKMLTVDAIDMIASCVMCKPGLFLG